MKFGYKHTIWASYIGYISLAIVNNLAPLLFLIFRDEFGIPLSKITFLITVNFLVQLTADAFSAKFIDKLGYKFSIIMAHIFVSVGLIGIPVFTAIIPDAYVGLVISIVLYAIGGGIIEVLISPIVEACPTENKSAIMSLLHSFYCWGSVAVILISTILLALLGKENWRVLPLVWAVLPVANALLFSKVPIRTLTEEGEQIPLKELVKDKLFWLFVILMICAGASEQGMSQWASAFAESGLKVSKTVGDLAGPCMFAILMGLARVFYAKCSEKIKLINFILGSAVLCVVSYLIAAFSPIPILSLIGCAICGLSVGIMWPGVFSLSAEKYPKGGTLMFAILALAGDLGCGGGPTLVGFVSGIFDDNLKIGLLIAIAFPIILLLIGMYLKNRKENK